MQILVRQVICLAIMVQTGALAGGGPALLDPVDLLRADPQVHRLEGVAVSASARRLRLAWGTSGMQVDLVFTSEATNAAQAGALRQITLAVNVPRRRGVTAAQVRALEQVAHTLAGPCLRRPLPALTPLLPSRLDQSRLLSAGSSPVQGIAVSLEASGTAPATDRLQVTVSLQGAAPHCHMPTLN